MNSNHTMVIQAELNKLWSEILGGIIKNNDVTFFALGGNSIQGIDLIEQVNTKFNVDLSIEDLFETLTINKLANLIESRVKCNKT